MKQNRREFLIKSSCALSMTALATQFRHFGLMSALAQKANKTTQTAVPSDYRALVCIFMLGGNDGNNSVIPMHLDASISNYTTYSNLRRMQGLALEQHTLLPINVGRIGNLFYGLHPSLGPGTTNNGIHELWAQNKMAIVANVGTLVQPTTRAQYQNFAHPKPYNLFSHSDQSAQHQSARSDRQIFTGWGGRISDHRSQHDNPNSVIPMITSMAGAQLFTAGTTTLPLAIAPAPTALNEVLNPQGYDSSVDSQAQLNAFHTLRTLDIQNSEVIAAASNITNQAMSVNSNLQSFQEVTVPFPNSNIGNQLKQVARLIKKRGDLNVNRQIFFCQIPGFDTHNLQLSNHINLLSQVGQAMRSFYDEMVAQGLGDKVTQFTLSDFSRTMRAAGTGVGVGTDHAWANHHFVVGGGVAGADFYGVNTSNGTPYPTLVLDGPDDADFGTGASGRWIPTTSVEQYAATLARWFGLPEVSMIDVFPKIGNYEATDMGFMRPA
jgi:uncharacterized protein (DUF1501 family)